MHKQRILVTGSSGFILGNFMRKAMYDGLNYEFISIDKMLEPHCVSNTYFNKKTHQFYLGDIVDEQFVENVFKLEAPIDYVIHGAAESFVDSSIESPKKFVYSNILGTQNMLDMSYKYGVKKFIYVSTDEVYGQLRTDQASWTEHTILNPRNSYSASKACGELMLNAFYSTHTDFNYVITRCCNNYGPNQAHRNLIPKIITSILKKEKIPLHNNGKPMREWIFVDDNNDALMYALKYGNNEIFNIGTGFEMSILDVANYICDIMGEGHDLITFGIERPGQDFRYLVDCSKIMNLGWKPKYDFDAGIKRTINWYVDQFNNIIHY